MKKKRILILLAVGVMVLCYLTGCGKSEKQTGYEQMKEDVQSELEENEQLHSQADATEAELDEKWCDVLVEEYNKYRNATDPEEIIETAKAYNEIFDKMTADVESFGFKPMNCSGINNTLVNDIGITGKIDELSYNVKSQSYRVSDVTDYDTFIYFYDSEIDSNVTFVYKHEENAILSNLLIVKKDSSVVEVNLSDFEKNDYSLADIYSINENTLIFWTNYNADSYYYEIDISGNTPVLITSGQGGCENFEESDNYSGFVSDIR